MGKENTCDKLQRCEWSCLPPEVLSFAESLGLGEDSLLKMCKIYNIRKFLFPKLEPELQKRISDDFNKDSFGERIDHSDVACVVEAMIEAGDRLNLEDLMQNLRGRVDWKNVSDIYKSVHLINEGKIDELLANTDIERHEKIYGVFIAMVEEMVEPNQSSEMLKQVLELAK